MEQPRKHPLARWKIPAALAAIPIVFVLAMGLWVEVSVTRRWSVMQSRTRDLLAEWDRLTRDAADPTSVQLWVSIPKGAAALEARVRLLRTAVHWKRTGERLKLQDPFGEHLNVQESSTGVKFWSTGPDGVDNLGAGGWKCGLDLVLEMPK